MKLKSLKIYNFGKLSGYETYFASGLNTIREDNGWGKTTLLAFIRVMFYGFKNERAKTPESRERVQYDPWSGGNYGGEIVFEHAGKTYFLQRLFGKKPADDVFVLKDAVTDLLSTDFSDNIGEELFKLNMDSFERTIFIGHNDCYTEANGDITANIGNLTDDTDDVNNYEKVMKDLNDIINKYHDRNIKGRVTQLNNEITEIQSDLRLSANFDATLTAQQEKKASVERDIKAARLKEEKLQAERKSVCSLFEIKSERDKYDALLNDYNERLEALNRAKSVFTGEIPTKEELKKLNDMLVELNRTEGELNSVEIARRDSIEKHCIAERQVSSIQEKVIKYKEMLKAAAEKDTLLATKKETILAFPKEKKLPMFILLIPGILMLSGAAVLFFEFSLLIYIIGTGTALLGLVFILFSFLFGFRTKENPEKEKLKREYGAIKEERLALDSLLSEKKLELTENLFEVDIIFDEASVDTELAELKNDVINYKKLVAATEKYENLKQQINSAFERFGCVETEMYAKQLSELNDRLSVIDNATEELKLAENRKKAYEDANDTTALLKTVIPDTLPQLTEIDEDIKKNSQEIVRLTELCKDYDRQIEDIQGKIDERSDKEAELRLKQAEVAETQRILNTARLTASYMEEAKALLTAKYKNPLEQGFKKYFEVFNGVNADDYRIDANARLKVTECDMEREVTSLSSGRQDVAWLCLRLAFADVMYQEHKPFIIMDDPFINLDDVSVRGGKEFIREIAKDYQLIYVTCSKSRE